VSRCFFEQGKLVLRDAASFLFPPECLVCQKLISAGCLCDSCRTFHPISGQICDRCGDELPVSMIECGACLGDHRWAKLTRIRSSLKLTSVSKCVLHRIKYGGRAELIEVFRRDFEASFSRFFPLDCVLIPVPLHPNRLLKRGFNVAVLLCYWLRQEFQLSVEFGSLMKPYPSTPQSLLNRRGRLGNLVGSFQWAGREGPPRRVLLVDDVYTTGATLRACARTLKHAKVEEIYGWTLFRAIKLGVRRATSALQPRNRLPDVK